MAKPIPETEGIKPDTGKRIAAGTRFMFGILGGFAITGVLFFTLLALWSILAGPFVHLESAGFVIVVALASSSALGIWLYRHLHGYFK